MQAERVRKTSVLSCVVQSTQVLWIPPLNYKSWWRYWADAASITGNTQVAMTPSDCGYADVILSWCDQNHGNMQAAVIGFGWSTNPFMFWLYIHATIGCSSHPLSSSQKIWLSTDQQIVSQMKITVLVLPFSLLAGFISATQVCLPNKGYKFAMGSVISDEGGCRFSPSMPFVQGTMLIILLPWGSRKSVASVCELSLVQENYVEWLTNLAYAS